MDPRSIARSVLAVLAGFLTMAVLVLALSWLAALATGVEEGEPTVAYLTLNVLGAAVAAAAGGWVTARVATGVSWAVWALVVMVVVLGMPGVVGGPAPGQPVWYPIAIVLIGGLGAALGGHLGRRERDGAVPAGALYHDDTSADERLP